MPNVEEYRKKFNIPIKTITKAVLNKLQPVNQQQLTRYIQAIQLKGYSAGTLKTYSNEFAQLLYTLNDKPVNTCSEDDVRNYILYCTNTLKLTENTLHSRINAIKFYFEYVLRKADFFIEIYRPKKRLKLPKVFNVTEVTRLLQVTDNLKHNTMLKLCYGMGLRVSEIVGLKIANIDSQAMTVLIEHGKGKKDRYVGLPESMLPQLRKYYLDYKPKLYLFEGQYGGQYSVRSVQQVFKNALRAAK